MPPHSKLANLRASAFYTLPFDLICVHLCSSAVRFPLGGRAFVACDCVALDRPVNRAYPVSMKTTLFPLLLLACLTVPAAAAEPSPDPDSAGAGVLPDAAFELLTREELEKFIAVFPAVQAALDRVDYDFEEPEFESLAGLRTQVAQTVEGIREIEGVKPTLDSAGIGWEEFSATIYKLLAVALEAFEDVLADLSAEFAPDEPEAKRLKNGQSPGSPLLGGRVPDQNWELVREYDDELDDLGVSGR